MVNGSEVTGLEFDIREYTLSSLENLRKQMGSQTVVPGVGPLDAELMIIGEAPGQQEDEQQTPFVGRSGELLNKILEKSGWDREKIYITNTVKCRPTVGKKNRPPTEEEIQACKAILWKELQIVPAKAIITLGTIPTKLLLKGNSDMVFNYKWKLSEHLNKSFSVPYLNNFKTKIYACYHPSYLLRVGQGATDRTIELFKFIKETHFG